MVAGLRRHATAYLAVDVLDRGPGVPAELRDRLFQPFGAGLAGRDGRTGLGLATAAAAVAAHGGRVRYGTGAGGGAWFRIEVPAPAAIARQPRLRAPRPRRARLTGFGAPGARLAPALRVAGHAGRPTRYRPKGPARRV